MTLIEAILYAILLSFLVAGFIALDFQAYQQDIGLIHAIEDAYHG